MMRNEAKKEIKQTVICLLIIVVLTLTGVLDISAEPEDQDGNKNPDVNEEYLHDSWQAYLDDPDHIQAKALTQAARSQLGTRCNLVGWIPEEGFTDVSFVIWCMKEAGIAEYKVPSRETLSTKCRDIRVNAPLPGDLIFFYENDALIHVGICLSENEFIHCSSEVRIDSYTDGNWWEQHVAGYGRVCSDRQIRSLEE